MSHAQSGIVRSVAAEVERALELPEGELLLGRGKGRTITTARAIACWCSRQLTPCPTLAEIGRTLGHNGHTLPLSASRRIERARETDVALRELTDAILARVRAKRSAHLAGDDVVRAAS